MQLYEMAAECANHRGKLDRMHSSIPDFQMPTEDYATFGGAGGLPTAVRADRDGRRASPRADLGTRNRCDAGRSGPR